MKLTRRNAIVGLGALAGGSGIIAGTGAFDTLDAERDVTVEFDDDTAAALRMTPGRDGTDDGNVIEYVDDGEGTGELGINLVNVNRNAVATVTGLIEFTNNTSQNINNLSFEIDSEGDHGEISIIDPNDLEENAGNNVLTEYDGDVSDDILGVGQSVTALSLEIDTTDDARDGELPTSSDDIDVSATITISTEAE